MYALLFYSIGIPNRASRITALHANGFTTLTPHKQYDFSTISPRSVGTRLCARFGASIVLSASTRWISISQIPRHVVKP